MHALKKLRLESEELNKIIETLESNASKDKATFGLYYRDGEDEMHLKANKYGFELFASELLKASRDSEIVINNKDKNYIPFGFKEKWIEGEMIAYLKPISEDRENITAEKPYVTTYKEDMFKFGCFAVIGILILSVVVGIYTIVNWFL